MRSQEVAAIIGRYVTTYPMAFVPKGFHLTIQSKAKVGRHEIKATIPLGRADFLNPLDICEKVRELEMEMASQLFDKRNPVAHTVGPEIVFATPPSQDHRVSCE